MFNMSTLFPAVENIISLLNNRYGTDISAEHFLTAYVPRYDENKEEFTKDDRKWLLQHLKSHSFFGGTKGLVKYMGDKFNNNLKQTIYDAARKFGDLEGVIKFLIDYDTLKNKLPKGKSPEQTGPAQRLDIAGPIKKIKTYLEKVKEEYPKEYNGSFYQYTDKILDKLQKYQRIGERYPRLEKEVLSIFVGDGEDNPGLIKNWRKLNVKGVSEVIKDIYSKLVPYTEKEEIRKKDIIDPPKESPLAALEKEIKMLSEKPSKVEDLEIELNKEMKGEKRKRVKEIVKDVKKEDSYKLALTSIKAYLKKAKSSFPDDFDQYGLHQYTLDMINVMEDYYTGKGRDSETNSKINDVFNETPGILKMWGEIHKPLAKDLRTFKNSFINLVKTKQDSPSSIDRKVLNQIENLYDKANQSITDKDKLIAKALLGKKEKKYRDPGTSIDPTFFNKLVKELIKNKDDIPKSPDADDLNKLDLTDEELEKAKTKEYLDLVGKTLKTVDQILLEDDTVSDEDIVSKVIEKFKEEFEKSKKKQEQEKKVVLDRDIKKEKEKEKSISEKQSSINIVSNYMKTLLYKLEQVSGMSSDKLVKAELENIYLDLKQIL